MIARFALLAVVSLTLNGCGLRLRQPHYHPICNLNQSAIQPSNEIVVKSQPPYNPLVQQLVQQGRALGYPLTTTKHRQSTAINNPTLTLSQITLNTQPLYTMSAGEQATLYSVTYHATLQLTCPHGRPHVPMQVQHATTLHIPPNQTLSSGNPLTKLQQQLSHEMATRILTRLEHIKHAS